jgi:ATP phosphoribosyltransferase regulatory subunit
VQELVLDALVGAGLADLTMDLADARILRAVLAGVPLDADALQEIAVALSNKDAPGLARLSAPLAAETRQGLGALLRLYGGAEVLGAARTELPARPMIDAALTELQWLSEKLAAAHPSLRIGFDLGDMSGYAYYSGVRFALYGAQSSDAVARGGRYDEIGAIFGRNRPAVGFSLDLKTLSELVPGHGKVPAILAPWSEDASLHLAVRRLREGGEQVVWALPGHAIPRDLQEFDRELIQTDGRWVIAARRV